MEPKGGSQPLSYDDLLKSYTPQQATADIPPELRTMMSDVSRALPAEPKFIEKGGGEDAPVEGYVPAWMSVSLRPRALPIDPPPELRHRGREAEPYVIWQPEDRRTYFDMTHPWGCNCRIFSGTRRSGSGVIVGPRHVLTASHVIDWRSPSAVVEVMRSGGTVQAVANATRFWSFTKIDTVGATTIDEDYAVIVTDQRLGDRFGFLGTRTYDSGLDGRNIFSNMGYANDIAGFNFPLFQSGKNLDEDGFDYGSGRAMRTSLDANHGQSGSGVFAIFNNEPFSSVVAVISGSAISLVHPPFDRDNWCSGGSDLTKLVRHARANDP